MDIQVVKESIEILRQIDFNDEYAYEKAVWNILRMVEVPILVDIIPKNYTVFRSRTHDNDTFYNNISEIGITPNKFISGFGRCNRPFQSVFYSSENRPTSYAELVESWTKSHNDGDSVYVTIGEWKLKKDANLIIVTSPNTEDRVSEFDKKYGAVIDEHISKLDSETQAAIKELYSFLFESFRNYAGDNKLIHLQTTAYSNVSLMHADAQADGIYYPSVPFLYQGVNFAINEAFANEHMELVSVMRNQLKLTKKDGEKPLFTEIESIDAKEINSEENLIIWNEH